MEDFQNLLVVLAEVLAQEDLIESLDHDQIFGDALRLIVFDDAFLDVIIDSIFRMLVEG